MIWDKKEKFKEYEEEKQGAFVDISERSVIVILKMKEMLDQISQKFFDNDLFSSIEGLHSVVRENFMELKKLQGEQAEVLSQVLQGINKLSEELMGRLSEINIHLNGLVENLESALHSLVERLNSLQGMVESIEKSRKQQEEEYAKNVYPL